MEYNIVPMDRSHIEQIAALERECFSTPWSEAMLTEALFDPQASFIVAEAEDGGVLGYAGLQVVLDEGYIDNIAVEPAARRHGWEMSCWTCSAALERSTWPFLPWRCAHPTPRRLLFTASTGLRKLAGGRITTRSPAKTRSS